MRERQEGVRFCVGADGRCGLFRMGAEVFGWCAKLAVMLY